MSGVRDKRVDTKRILLVEDDSDHAELAKHCLHDYDERLVVHHVIDGVEALDYLRNRNNYADPEKSPRPHLILLDLRMHRVDGFEVLKEVKGTDDLMRIPVVILTTSESEIDANKAYDLHANSFLVKPGGYHELKKMLIEVSNYWLAINKRLW